MIESELIFRGVDAAECTTFIREVHKYAHREGKFRDYAWMADLAALAFDGPALIWFDRQNLETQADWILLRRALLDQYCDNRIPPPHSSAIGTTYTRTSSPNQDRILEPKNEPAKASYAGLFPTGVSFIIRNAYSMKVMDLMKDNPAPGTPVANWTVNGGKNQSWILEAGEYGYKIKSAAHNNSYLGFAQGVSPTTQGNIISGNPTPVEWTITRQNNHIFLIHLASHPNLVLDLASYNSGDGARIIVWPNKNTGDNQGWIFEATA